MKCTLLEDVDFNNPQTRLVLFMALLLVVIYFMIERMNKKMFLLEVDSLILKVQMCCVSSMLKSKDDKTEKSKEAADEQNRP